MKQMLALLVDVLSAWAAGSRERCRAIWQLVLAKAFPPLSGLCQQLRIQISVKGIVSLGADEP